MKILFLFSLLSFPYLSHAMNCQEKCPLEFEGKIAHEERQDCLKQCQKDLSKTKNDKERQKQEKRMDKAEQEENDTDYGYY